MYIARLNNNDIRQYQVLLNKYIVQLISHDNKNISNKANQIYNNMLKYTQDGSAIILGALNDNILLGFIWAYKINNNTIHINYFCVNSDNRNSGIGTLLLKEIEKEAIKYSKEINAIELLVNKTNKSAIEFYKKNGFSQSNLVNEKIKFIKKIGA